MSLYLKISFSLALALIVWVPAICGAPMHYTKVSGHVEEYVYYDVSENLKTDLFLATKGQFVWQIIHHGTPFILDKESAKKLKKEKIIIISTNGEMSLGDGEHHLNIAYLGGDDQNVYFIEPKIPTGKLVDFLKHPNSKDVVMGVETRSHERDYRFLPLYIANLGNKMKVKHQTQGCADTDQGPEDIIDVNEVVMDDLARGFLKTLKHDYPRMKMPDVKTGGKAEWEEWQNNLSLRPDSPTLDSRITLKTLNKPELSQLAELRKSSQSHYMRLSSEVEAEVEKRFHGKFSNSNSNGQGYFSKEYEVGFFGIYPDGKQDSEQVAVTRDLISGKVIAMKMVKDIFNSFPGDKKPLTPKVADASIYTDAGIDTSGNFIIHKYDKKLILLKMDKKLNLLAVAAESRDEEGGAINRIVSLEGKYFTMYVSMSLTKIVEYDGQLHLQKTYRFNFPGESFFGSAAQATVAEHVLYLALQNTDNMGKTLEVVRFDVRTGKLSTPFKVDRRRPYQENVSGPSPVFIRQIDNTIQVYYSYKEDTYQATFPVSVF